MSRILIIIFFLPPIILHAQIDREFWFAVPEISAQHADRPIRLHLSAQNQDANVTISIPANPSFSPITLTLNAYSSTTQDITSYINDLENIVYNTPQNKGLFIQSDYPITAYYEVLGGYSETYNTDIFTLKGSNALGLEFYTPFQTNYKNQDIDAWSSIDIVATEDSTQITFELTQLPFEGNTKNFTITLNRGQTYSIRCNSVEGSLRLTGSKITSNKPIAITLKDDSILGPTNDNWDLVGDQIVPTDIIGTEYIITPGETFFLATENNTTIDIGGSVITLNEGETYYANVFDVSVINSNSPIYVWQILAQGSEYGGALIPHSQCSGSYNVGFNRTSQERFTLIILVKTGGENDFIMNGNTNLINASDFNTVQGTGGDWKYLIKTFSNEEIPTDVNSYIENTSKPFQMGFTNGSEATGNRFGYFSNYDVLELGIDFYACDNTVLQVPKGLDTYLWSTGSTENLISVDSSGQYWVQATEGNCFARDSVDVVIKPGVEHQFIGDTFICSVNGVYLEAAPDSTLHYLWSTGDTTNYAVITEAGDYSVTITNEFLCRVTDNINIKSLIILGNYLSDTIICNDPISLMTKEDEANFIWKQDIDTISTSTSTLIADAGTFTLTKYNRCDTIIDTFVVEKRNILPPNVFTPNEDNINDNFTVTLGSGEWQFEVFNRWGKNIYRNDNFNGEWLIDNLNDGLYYYNIQDQFCNRNYNGWIQVLK